MTKSELNLVMRTLASCRLGTYVSEKQEDEIEEAWTILHKFRVKLIRDTKEDTVCFWCEEPLKTKIAHIICEDCRKAIYD